MNMNFRIAISAIITAALFGVLASAQTPTLDGISECGYTRIATANEIPSGYVDASGEARIALTLGLLLALLRVAPSRFVSWPTGLFLEFVRNTPLLVQLYFLYFVLPDFGIVLPAFLAGAVALGLRYSAHTAEVYAPACRSCPKDITKRSQR
jgi:His/Glu/Gln/Arg/opine family amino acid ABC transporter permease subunit